MPSIYLADGDELFRTTLASALRERGAEVREFAGGPDLASRALREQPDLILFAVSRELDGSRVFARFKGPRLAGTSPLVVVVDRTRPIDEIVRSVESFLDEWARLCIRNLTAVLTWLQARETTGWLELEAFGEPGKVVLRKGALVEARWRDLRGRKVVEFLAENLPDVGFRFVEQAEEETPELPAGATWGLPAGRTPELPGGATPGLPSGEAAALLPAPDTARLHLELAQALLERNQTGDALLHLRIAQDASGLEHEVRYLMGLAHLRSGDLRQALDDLFACQRDGGADDRVEAAMRQTLDALAAARRARRLPREPAAAMEEPKARSKEPEAAGVENGSTPFATAGSTSVGMERRSLEPGETVEHLVATAPAVRPLEADELADAQIAADAAALFESFDRATPDEPLEPAGADDPAESVLWGEPTAPIDSTAPVDSAAPIERATPVDEAAPIDSTTPADPTAPADSSVPGDWSHAGARAVPGEETDPPWLIEAAGDRGPAASESPPEPAEGDGTPESIEAETAALFEEPGDPDPVVPDAPESPATLGEDFPSFPTLEIVRIKPGGDPHRDEAPPVTPIRRWQHVTELVWFEAPQPLAAQPAAAGEGAAPAGEWAATISDGTGAQPIGKSIGVGELFAEWLSGDRRFLAAAAMVTFLWIGAAAALLYASRSGQVALAGGPGPAAGDRTIPVPLSSPAERLPETRAAPQRPPRAAQVPPRITTPASVSPPPAAPGAPEQLAPRPGTGSTATSPQRSPGERRDAQPRRDIAAPSGADAEPSSDLADERTAARVVPVSDPSRSGEESRAPTPVDGEMASNVVAPAAPSPAGSVPSGDNPPAAPSAAGSVSSAGDPPATRLPASSVPIGDDPPADAPGAEESSPPLQSGPLESVVTDPAAGKPASGTSPSVEPSAESSTAEPPNAPPAGDRVYTLEELRGQPQVVSMDSRPVPAQVLAPDRLRESIDVRSGRIDVVPDLAGSPPVRRQAVAWVLVDASGHVEEVQILRSTGSSELDRDAVEAVRNVGFTSPGYRGTAIPAWFMQQVLFKTD